MDELGDLVRRSREEHPLPPVPDGPVSWAVLSARQGRNDLPHLVITRWHDLPAEDRPKALTAAWTLPEFPERHAEASVWTDLFDDVGYLVDGVVTAQDDDPGLPGDVVTLWRGATLARRSGMSWTTSRQQAKWFRDRFTEVGGTEPTHLFRIDIPREYLLARFTGRGEEEVVVATATFDDEEYVIEE